MQNITTDIVTARVAANLDPLPADGIVIEHNTRKVLVTSEEVTSTSLSLANGVAFEWTCTLVDELGEPILNGSGAPASRSTRNTKQGDAGPITPTELFDWKADCAVAAVTACDDYFVLQEALGSVLAPVST